MNRTPIRYRPNPLAAWFLLVTIAAVFCTFLPSISSLEAPGWPIVLGGICAIATAAIGGCFAPRLRNAGLGFLSGVLVGGAAGILLGQTSGALTVPVFSVLAGSVMIVVVGFLGRAAK